MTDTPLRLLSVHAHPDDEASKGSALVARYVSEGIGATLVCCTGGELGDVLARDPETVIAQLEPMVTDERRARLLSEKGRTATPGCSPENVWINDGGFNGA